MQPKPDSDAANEAKTRGQRLKRLRNLTNLSRQEFCERESLNINTFKGWEIGRHGGLTQQAAIKLSKAFSHYGVICSAPWLLAEEGPPPQLITELTPRDKKDHSQSECRQINNELNFLRQSYQDLVHYQLIDNTMEPFYHKGDHVAGIELQTKFHKLIGRPVIARLNSEKVVVRTLRRCELHKTLCLYAGKSKKHDIHNPEIITLATISWHRSPIKSS